MDNKIYFPTGVRLFLLIGSLLTAIIAYLYKPFTWVFSWDGFIWSIFHPFLAWTWSINNRYDPLHTFAIILGINIALFWHIIFFKNSKYILRWAIILPYIFSLLFFIIEVSISNDPNAGLVFIFVLPATFGVILIGNIFQSTVWKLLSAKRYLIFCLFTLLLWGGLVFYVDKITTY